MFQQKHRSWWNLEPLRSYRSGIYFAINKNRPDIKEELDNAMRKLQSDIQFDKALGRRYYEEDMQILKTGKSTRTIDHFVGPDGSETYLEILKEAIRNDEGEIVGICGICNDVTELEILRRQYEKLSLFDPMTGAYNRNYGVECDFDRAEMRS